MISKKLISQKPYIIYNSNNIIQKINQWKQLLPSIQPYYAVKSNPNKNILNLLNQHGVNFDCASKNELYTVVNSFKKPKQIIFANPCKMIEHIKYAKNKNIDLMTFDSYEELKKIYIHHYNAQLIIRIKVDDSKSVLKFNSKFGASIKEACLLLQQAKILGLNVIGTSFHVGSKCNDENAYYNAIYNTRQVYEIAKSFGFNFTTIDIGGGFPGSDDSKFKHMTISINKAINDFYSSMNMNFIAEPGRYFVESCYIVVAIVINKKIIIENNKKKIIYYLSDGVYGSFNNVINEHAQLSIKTDNSGLKYTSVLFGPTCDSIDCIAKDIELPELNINDPIYIENMGAYTTACSTSFNGFNPITLKN
jgi:diaminopimelate decarboxylase